MRHTTEITDLLVVFDSFSVFVEPVSYQRNFHLVSVLYVTPPWRNIRSTVYFDFGSTSERFTLSKSITRRFFKIPDLYVSPPVLTFHSLAPCGYIFFKDVLKSHSRYNDFRRHYRLIVQSKLHITPAPSNLTKYAQNTLCTKTPLSRGVTGKTFPDTEKNNKLDPP